MLVMIRTWTLWQRNCKAVFLLPLADVRCMVHISRISMSGI
ncbi:hypothetical protein QYF36_008512 [Acer negundo]|nr:hypothetical protein QYF36_008512 [Acer negundo]